MTILVVVAHPDDEVLGAGGTLATFAKVGLKSRACIACAKAEVRTMRPGDDELVKNTEAASASLGMGPPILGEFPNIRLNTVGHLDLVQFIERAIVEVQATVVFTHHPRDLNDDHRNLSLACQAAVRLFQRRSDVPRLRGLYFMEVLSSTEWSFPGATHPFDPDTFVEIGCYGLEKKIQALGKYKNVMRDYPHPRSKEALSALATYRGSQSGTNRAEAFQTAFSILNPDNLGT